MAPYTAVVGLWALAYCGRMSTSWLPNEGRRKKRQPSSLPPCVVCGLFAKSICGGPPSVLRFGYTPNTTRCVVIAGRKWPRRLSAGLPLSPNLTRLKNTHYHVPRRSFLQRLFCCCCCSDFPLAVYFLAVSFLVSFNSYKWTGTLQKLQLWLSWSVFVFFAFCCGQSCCSLNKEVLWHRLPQFFFFRLFWPDTQTCAGF